MAKSVIGLDIGTTGVRAFEAQRGRGAPVVLRYGEVALPPGAVRDGEVAEPSMVVPALRRLWSEGRFSHRDVVMGVGNQRVIVRNLEMPRMPMPQLRAALPFQVEEALPMPVEDALLDYYPTGEVASGGNRTVEGLLVAATRDTVQSNVTAAESAGLRPLVVDLNAFALTRAHAAGGTPARTVALVDVGARTTTIAILADGAPRLVRTLPSGGQNVTDAIVGAMNVPQPEAEALKRQIGVGFAVPPELQVAAEMINHVAQSLVEGIRNTLLFYASNNPGAGTEVVALSGGGAYLNGLGQYLSSAVRLPVTLVDLLARFTVAKSANLAPLQGREASAATSLGLALAVAA